MDGIRSRSRSIKVIEADKKIIERIKLIKSHHTFWGYRRIWAYLNYRENVLINKKRVYRLLKENNLLVERNNLLKAKRYTGSVKKPRPEKPNEWWGIDMTKRMMRTLKEELVWVNEWESPAQFIQALDRWVEKYNNEYLHSALDYQTPVNFEKQFGDSTLEVA